MYGGMDPYSSGYIILKNTPYNPIPPSFLSAKELCRFIWIFGVQGLGLRVRGMYIHLYIDL